MAKRRRLQHGKARKPPQSTKPKNKQSRKQQQQQQQQRPIIPFAPADRILLVGEGDLSFAASVIKHHGCVNVTATVQEKDHAELVAKYPAVDANISVVLGVGEDEGADGGRGEGEGMGDGEDLCRGNGDADDADEDDSDADDDMSGSDAHDSRGSRPHLHLGPRNNRLLYNVDAAKKLPPSLSRPPLHDHVLFNFPHVGGKSTDVNRQVRHNQSLLVAFFASALAVLAPRGSVVVTLFDGEPYTLWNVRDLARHAGLAVDSSFAFDPATYPGYRHSRTCGVVTSRSGRVGGGWKGEHRPARSFVFRRKGDVEAQPVAKRKRPRGHDGSSSDDDED